MRQGAHMRICGKLQCRPRGPNAKAKGVGRVARFLRDLSRTCCHVSAKLKTPLQGCFFWR